MDYKKFHIDERSINLLILELHFNYQSLILIWWVCIWLACHYVRLFITKQDQSKLVFNSGVGLIIPQNAS